MAEPVLLLLAGLVLPQPRKTLRWAVGSLLLTGCFVAGVGLLEQVVGPSHLALLGFTYNQQIRTIQGHLRSFGTMDEPFAYASFLLLAFAAILFARRRIALAFGAAGAVLLAGVAVSYVRTALLILFAFAALEQVPVHLVVGVRLGDLAVTDAELHRQSIVGGASVYPFAQNLLLGASGLDALSSCMGSPSDWPFGRGVGEVGTAAERAGYKLTPGPGTKQRNSLAVDSGYFATVADVGIVGLIVLLALFGRIAYLAREHVLRGADEGWLTLAILAAILADAVTRSSFIGFPSAFLEMFLLGIALNAARESAAERTQ